MTSGRMVLSGAMPGGENWTCGYWNTPADASAQAAADRIATAATFVTFLNDIQGINGPGWTCNLLTQYLYAGGFGSPATDVGTHVLSSAGITSTTNPNQTAIVTNLYSRIPGTKPVYNRAFLPATKPGAISGGVISGTLAQAIATDLAALVSVADLTVYSPKNSSDGAVTSVEVGNVLDAMNSRRNRLTITKFTATP